MDISAWTAHWARFAPDRVAVRFEGRELGYAALEERVATAAAALRARGVAPGDRVAYLGPNCPEVLELLLACARSGAIFVPLNARMPAAELRGFAQLTGPALLVAETGLGELAAETLDGARVVTFAAGGDGGALAAAVTGAGRLAADPALDGATAVLVAFTSGTTATPKGATFTHANLTCNALNVLTACGLAATDEVLTAIPMFHVGGLLIHTTPALLAGAGNTIHREFDAGALLDDVERHRITLLACVPAMTAALVRDERWEDADLASLRSVLTGSTFVPRRAVVPWQRRGVPIVQGYGMTETCPVVTQLPPGRPHAAALTAGPPVLYQRIRIAGDDGADLPAGEPGEIRVRGPSVMRGYWGNDRATAEAFDGDGWFRSGDVGLVGDDGCLRVVERRDDVIIVASSNVYPSDLQAVLDDCDALAEAAVVGAPDDELGQVPVACVVRAAGSDIGRDEILGLFDDTLADYKHPREVVFLDALPRTVTGKVDRGELAALAERARDGP